MILGQLRIGARSTTYAALLNINMTKHVIRLAGTICGCFYGPYIYLALPIGGIYLAGHH